MADLSKNPQQFSRILLNWHLVENSRQMPWKNEKDPYKIWLSEIILQQTRVEQGLNYYNRFITAFPDINALANATEAAVFKLWEGLGYYSRCRNLIATAKFISAEWQGIFPSTYEEIRSLKGVGPYTAAAISSFAFNLPYAVLDGNVFRVLSRIFGIDTPIDSSAGKKKFTELSNLLLDKKQPAIYNQAIMDFGAVICKPQPRCDECPFRSHCFAFQQNKMSDLPVKEKKVNVRKRWFYYFVVKQGQTIVIRQRTAKDIWQNLYEFPMIETSDQQDLKAILLQAEKNLSLASGSYDIESVSSIYKQQLTHQLIVAQFIRIRLKEKLQSRDQMSACLRITNTQLRKYALPKVMNEYLVSEGMNEIIQL